MNHITTWGWVQDSNHVMQRIETIYNRLATRTHGRQAEIKMKILGIIRKIVQNNSDEELQTSVDQALMERKLTNSFMELAFFSPITWLLSRIWLANKITQEFDQDKITTAIVFDIDHLKKYNTEHGHDGGDKAIQHVWMIANRIVEQSRNGGQGILIEIAHLSGDEFVIAVLGDVDHGKKIVWSIQDELKKTPIKIDSTEYTISITCGIATTEHVHEYSPDIQQKSWWTHIPLWFAKVMKLADDAVTLADRWSSYICDGKVPNSNLDDTTKKFVTSLSDMLRGIENQNLLIKILLEMIEKIATFQNLQQNLSSIKTILSTMKNDTVFQMDRRSIWYINAMLEMTIKLEDK